MPRRTQGSSQKTASSPTPARKQGTGDSLPEHMPAVGEIVEPSMYVGTRGTEHTAALAKPPPRGAEGCVMDDKMVSAEEARVSLLVAKRTGQGAEILACPACDGRGHTISRDGLWTPHCEACGGDGMRRPRVTA